MNRSVPLHSLAQPTFFWEHLAVRKLLLIVLACVGCTRTSEQDVSAEAADSWRVGLTDEQVSAVLEDREACSQMHQKLTDAAGDPAPGSIEEFGLRRLQTHYDEYVREVQAGNLKTAAAYFREQIEGKELIDLAWEQSAEPPPPGR
jgi:hypothetical protein